MPTKATNSLKSALLRTIQAAHEAKLNEQRGYREIIRAAQDKPATDGDMQLLFDLQWQDIRNHMAGHNWPPASQDWEEQGGLAWDQVPKQKQLELIEDQDIRFAIYFLSEVSDHAERLKAAAKFYTLFGVTSKMHDAVFACWVHTILSATMASESKPPKLAGVLPQ